MDGLAHPLVDGRACKLQVAVGHGAPARLQADDVHEALEVRDAFGVPATVACDDQGDVCGKVNHGEV